LSSPRARLATCPLTGGKKPGGVSPSTPVGIFNVQSDEDKMGH
jgi:hypothetical protein